MRAVLSSATPSPTCWPRPGMRRSEEHTSELQSLQHLVCRLLLEKRTAAPSPPPSRGYTSRRVRRARSRAPTHAARRRIERDLHDGPHLSLVSLALIFFLSNRGPPDFHPFPTPDLFPI